MNPPPPHPPEPPQPPRSSYLSLVLAAMLGLGIFAVLFFLTLGAVGPMLLIGGGVFALAALHYIVWGWWLSKYIREEVEDEQRRS